MGLKLQVGCTNQQKILIGLFDVMCVVVSVHAPVAVVGNFFCDPTKKRKEKDDGGGTLDEWKR